MAMNVSHYFNYFTSCYFLVTLLIFLTYFFCSFRSTTVNYRDRVFPTIKVRTYPRRDRKAGVSCETEC